LNKRVNAFTILPQTPSFSRVSKGFFYAIVAGNEAGLPEKNIKTGAGFYKALAAPVLLLINYSSNLCFG
jgi:hypothetical protein